jgi:hypothetical protein
LRRGSVVVSFAEVGDGTSTQRAHAKYPRLTKSNAKKIVRTTAEF